MHVNCVYKRLISVNIVLLLIFTMISTTIFAYSDESQIAAVNNISNDEYIIINGVKYDANEESVGRGWSYHASEKNSRYSTNTLLLWGYNGSSIIYSGKSGKMLSIKAIKFANTITGNNEPGIRCLNGNLEISVFDGNNEDTSFEIKGGANYAGVSLEETESNLKIRSSSRTSSERAIPYISIYGGKNAPGIKAGKAEIKTGYKSNVNIYGGTSESAVKVKNTLELGGDGNISLFGSGRGAVASDIDHSEKMVIYNGNQYNLVAGNNEYDAVKITEYSGEYYLKCNPITCNLTIDANGGAVNESDSITLEIPIGRGYTLDKYILQNNGNALMGDTYIMVAGDNKIVCYRDKYVLKRDGYVFAGWYKNKDNEGKIQNALNVSKTVKENKNQNFTVYAGWFKVDKGDIIVDATNYIDGDSGDLSYHNNSHAARSDGTKYMKLNTDENQCKLPYSIYSGWNKFNGETQQYEWTIREYEQIFWADRDVLEEKVFTDLNGKEYYLTTKGLYRSGDRAKNDSGDIKIFVPYSGAIDCVIYNLSGMQTYDSGNLIKQELVTTSQDLCVYTIDDQYIDNPDNKELIGWSLKPDASTLDYEVGEKIEVKTGDRNINLYAIWVDKNEGDKTVTFSGISENTGLCYAAFYDSKGKQTKTVEVIPDADRNATVKCGQEEYYRIDHIKLFTMSADRFAPVQAVQTAVRNSSGGFDIQRS